MKINTTRSKLSRTLLVLGMLGLGGLATASLSQQGGFTARHNLVRMNRTNLERGIPEGATVVATGFIVGHPRLALTNAHAILPCHKITVSTLANPYAEYGASILGIDTTIDAALLQLDRAGPAYLALQTQNPGPDGRVALMSYPGVGSIAGGPKVAEGWIKRPTRENPDLFGLEAPLRAGESGGPAIDGAGRVVAMIVGREADGATDQSLAVGSGALTRFMAYHDQRGDPADALQGVPGGDFSRKGSFLGLGSPTIDRDALEAMKGAVVRFKCD